jgi:hypothetical protein
MSKESFAKMMVKAPLGIVLAKPGGLLQHHGVTFDSSKQACTWCHKK